MSDKKFPFSFAAPDNNESIKRDFVGYQVRNLKGCVELCQLPY